jgi:hypothetical protein
MKGTHLSLVRLFNNDLTYSKSPSLGDLQEVPAKEIQQQVSNIALRELYLR